MNIRYPQDFDLLNEARGKLEAIIIRCCKGHGLPCPRMYRRQARKNYLALANDEETQHEKDTGNIPQTALMCAGTSNTWTP